MSRAGGALALVRTRPSDALYERLHAQRGDYEQTVRLRFPGAFDVSDAEDIVSTALERVLHTERLPEPDAEEAWFSRVVANAALDELRRQHGRAGGAKRGGALRNIVHLSELTERGDEVQSEDELTDPEHVVELLEEPAQRALAMAQTKDVLNSLDPEDRRLLLIRHFELPDAGRVRCAMAAGITVEAWRHRYRRAWERFVDAVAAAEPTDHCRPVRDLIGELDAGTLRNGAAKTARSKVDVHVLECTACRVFARESYRILSLTPVAPTGGVVIERLVEQGSAVAARNGELVAGGAAGGSVGLLALVGGGLGGGLKALAIVCTVSATAAGVCGGVIAAIDVLNGPEHKQQAVAEPRRKPPAPTPRPTATNTPPPVRTPSPTAQASKPKREQPAKTQSQPRDEQPAAVVPTGSTGQEFDPVPSGAQAQPAPVAASAGGGEFAP